MYFPILAENVLIRSRYIQQCELLMPQLEHAFTLAPQAIPFLDHQCLVQLTEVGLTSSNFRDRSWKALSISIADNAANAMDVSSLDRAVYRALVGVRKAFLAHLYEAQSEWQANTVSFPIFDHRSNALSSMLAIAKAREHVSQNTLTAAYENLMSFKPQWDGSVSRLADLQNKQIMLMRSNVLRCQGQFREALVILESLTPRDSRVVSLLGNILCELGKCDEAIQELNVFLVAAAKNSQSTIRVKLSLATAHLMKYMQVCSKGQGLDWRALQASREQYEVLRACMFPSTYLGKLQHLSILIGIAIVEHLNGRVDVALRAWQTVSATSQAFLMTGYTDMIFAFSTSELELRRGATAQADVQRNYAKILFSRTGRQYHFAGLGSYWPDILNHWYVVHGKEPLD